MGLVRYQWSCPIGFFFRPFKAMSSQAFPMSEHFSSMHFFPGISSQAFLSQLREAEHEGSKETNLFLKTFSIQINDLTSDRMTGLTSITSSVDAYKFCKSPRDLLLGCHIYHLHTLLNQIKQRRKQDKQPRTVLGFFFCILLRIFMGTQKKHPRDQ